MNTPVLDRRAVAALWKGVREADVEEACARVETAAIPRSVHAEFSCADLSALWQGNDIRRHLAGCERCVLVCLTLGSGVDQMLRAAGVGDVWQSALLDGAASSLVELCADEAEAALRAEYEARGEYLTRRFSPGYGDFPLTLQPEFLRLTNAQKRIGLTVTDTCILIPRKSVTAVCGISATPSDGAIAGCATCALRETCQRRKEGNPCGKQHSDS